MSNAKVMKFIKYISPSNVGECTPVAVSSPMLHISADGKIKEFSPSVSQRTMNIEDRTIPRISCSEYLFGCIEGYASSMWDFIDPLDKFKGGYHIYKLPVKTVIVPSKKLVPDVEHTSEKWVVGFDPAHAKFSGDKIGKLFLGSVVITGADKKRKYDCSWFLEVKEEIPFTDNIVLVKGHYKISTSMDHRHLSDSSNIAVVPISSGDYAKAKKVSASLLSYQEPKPSQSWQ